jgi:peptidylamidoglycolate lyase
LFSDYSRVENWPTPSKQLGAISAVALDVYKNVVVFHRNDRIWNSQTFDPATNVYKQRNLGPIAENTIVTFHRETGNVLVEWGKNMFYVPHGLHINGNYYYVTDVGKFLKQFHND